MSSSVPNPERNRKLPPRWHERITDRVVSTFRAVGGVSRRSGQTISISIPRSRGGASVAREGLLVGKVISHTGASRAATYTIDLADGTRLVNKTPRRRGELSGAEFDIRPAGNGTPCYYSIESVGGVPTVILHSCEEEVDSEACAVLPGSGAPGSGVTAIEQANTPLRATTKLVIAQTFDVAALGIDRKGFQLYSFPLGAIDIRSVVADLVISSSAVTNVIDVGIGTESAEGTNGTGLSGTLQDVVVATTPGAISAALDYERIWPTTGETRPVLYDGTAAAIAMYLNIACNSASWDATGSVSVTGVVRVNWIDAGEFDG